MSFLDLAAKRRSIRAYRPDPVEPEKLEQVLEAARTAPSACNKQPWVFVVVRDAARRAQFQRVYPKEWLFKAPVIVAACCDTQSAWVRKQDGKRHGDVDLAIAVDRMTLCAAELGLGTCWVCAFDPVAAREVLGLPAHVEPVALFPLGYPAEEGRPTDRKAMNEIVRYEQY